MNLIQKFRLHFMIRKQLKRINKIVRDLEKRMKSNPSLYFEDVSPENLEIYKDCLQKLIEYKTLLNEDCSNEKGFLKELEAENKII